MRVIQRKRIWVFYFLIWLVFLTSSQNLNLCCCFFFLPGIRCEIIDLFDKNTIVIVVNLLLNFGFHLQKRFSKIKTKIYSTQLIR